MPKELFNHTLKNCKKNSAIGLLATEGTLKTGIYNKFYDKKYKLIYPDSSLQKRFRGTDPKNLNQADHNFYSGKHNKPNVGYKEISNSLGISIANYQASQSLPAPIKITEEFLQVINSHKQKTW